MARAFVFPGQGSQAVGMGRELAAAFVEARDVFGEVDEALSQKLSALMFEGPEADLTLTENAQPALMAVSAAVVQVLRKQGGLDFTKTARFVAGHSLGEYSALCAAGSFSLADTARLLKLRGRSMQKAVPVGQGAMAAVLSIDPETLQEIAKEAAVESGKVCAVANDNGPGQVVISGDVVAVDRALAIAATRGFKRSVKLPVSAPFHCRLMAPAADAMAEALAGVSIVAPVVPLVANVVATAVSDPDEIRRLLVEQVTGMVRWRESMLYVRSHDVDTVVELGSGKVLTGLAKRIDKDLAGISVNTPADIENFLKTL
ncbi:MAG: ACP S-malonyltransferase [Rhodospirillaceae bacterium]